MRYKKIDRRTVLKAGAYTFALPLLEAMLPTLAQAAAGAGDPKRYVCIYIPSGTYFRRNDGGYWQPGKTAGPLSANALPEVFSPFSANVADFTILRGMHNAARYQCGGTQGDHSTAIASYLTSAPYTNGGAAACTLSGNSFDNEIAIKNGLTAYALSGGGDDGYHADATVFDYSRTISYANSKQSDCYLSPYKLFYSSGIFANLQQGTSTTPAVAAPLRPLARNKSILDHAIAAINELKAGLGRADVQRVDDYYDGLRAVEKTLASTAPSPTMTGNQCNGITSVSTTLMDDDKSGDRDDFPDRMKAFMDVIVLAFRGNRAQVFSMITEYENTNRRFRGLVPSNLVYMGADMNRPGSHNEICHWSDDGPGQETERRNRCVTRDRFYASFFVYLMNELKKTTDPSGSRMLDNTVIQFGHGLMDGNHNTNGEGDDMGLPLVLGGGSNLITPGQFRVLNADLKDLYYTLNQKMGMGLTNFRGSSTLIGI